MKWFFLIIFVIIQTNGYVQECGNSEIAEKKYDGILKNLELTNDRVLRGKESELNQWPWIVHLYIDFFFGGTFNCTGSVIHPHWILTAAHCLEWDLSVTTVDVYYGSNEKSKLEKLTVKKIYRYPKYDEKKAYYGDIALLELAPDSYIPETITPICLFKDDELEDEESMVVAGWGYDLINISSSNSNRTAFDGETVGELNVKSPQILLENVVVNRRDQQCSDLILKDNGTDDFNQYICQHAINTGSMQGDSGGPLMVYRNGKFVQVGLTSFGEFFNVPNSQVDLEVFGIYTRISYYCDWIIETTRNAVGCLRK